MKKLTCEMCESTDFVKQEGTFVCQSCGLKYSAEEAKKMMTDGTAVATGNVAVGNSSKLDNLYQLARRARDEKNSEKATQYYEQILLEDPNSWEAIFYSTYYAAIQKWRKGDNGSAIASLQNCIGNVIDIIIGTDKEQVAVMEISGQLCYICESFHRANKENFESFHDDYMNAGFSSHNYNLLIQTMNQTAILNKSIALIYYVFGTKVLEIINNKNSYNDIFGDIVETTMKFAVEIVNNNPLTKYPRWYSVDDDNIKHMKSISDKETSALVESCSKVCSMLKQKKEALAKQRFEEYWDSHSTEKAALESEKVLVFI